MNPLIRKLPSCRHSTSALLQSSPREALSRSLTSSSTCRSSPLQSSSSSSSPSASNGPQAESLDEIDPQHFQQPQISPVRYPYFVSRAGAYSDSLPVYTDIKHGGQSVFTILRKVQGNVEALRKDLENSLPSLLIPEPIPSRGPKARAGRTLEPAHPTKSQPIKASKVGAVGKIVIRGDRRREIREWLEERGF